MKGFSFFSPLSAQNSCSVDGKFFLSASFLRSWGSGPPGQVLWVGQGQVAGPQKRPSKLVREGQSQAHLHLGPASPTCALGEDGCQLARSADGPESGRYRQRLWPRLLAPFIKAAGQLQNRE